ncbi:MAG: toll/interleukin-1 receptor domain-containing protein [Methanoregula sp.]
MEYAFLCHSSKDKELVENLAEKLGRSNVYYDKWNLDAGDLIPGELARGIIESKWFIIIASQNSMNSRWVKFEVNLAITQYIKNENYRIIVVRIDDCKIHPELQSFLYIDCPNKPFEAIEKILDLILKDGGKTIAHEQKIRDWRSAVVNRFDEMRAIESVSLQNIKFIFIYGLFWNWKIYIR